MRTVAFVPLGLFLALFLFAGVCRLLPLDGPLPPMVVLAGYFVWTCLVSLDGAMVLLLLLVAGLVIRKQ